MLLENRLQVRDWEILRTLARCHFVPTRLLTAGFFGTASATRRRLARLSAFDLIRPHTKGIPAGVRYSAWRLTPVGAGLVEVGFPREPIEDDLVERISEQSLWNLDHREALTRLYIGILVGGDGTVPARDLRARADAFTWSPDGTVVLRYRDVAGGHAVVPDATVHSAAQGIRVFVEMDRSTHALRRMSEGLSRYERYLRTGYATDYADGARAAVLFVVASKRRIPGLAPLVARHLDGVCVHHVLPFDEAVSWLRSVLLGAAVGERLARAASLAQAARGVYEWARAYQEELRGQGCDLPPAGRALLRDLHRALAAEANDA